MINKVFKILFLTIVIGCNIPQNTITTNRIPLRVNYYDSLSKKKILSALFDSITSADSIEYGYYKNGNVKYTLSWFNGELEGNAYDFHKNGSVSNVTQYSKGIAKISMQYYEGDNNEITDSIGLVRIYTSKNIQGITYYDSTGKMKTFQHYYWKGFTEKELRKYKDGELDSVFYYNKKGNLVGVAW